MTKFLKNFKAYWLIELFLFAGGFLLVYKDFVPRDGNGQAGAEGKGTGGAAAVVSEADSEPQSNSRTALETAVVCLDIDVEEQKPLLAKGRFSKHIDVLFCYTEISGIIPDVLIHDWIFENTVPYRQRITLEENQRRAWSKMSMSPDKSGTWRVDIRTGSGDYLGSADFVLK